MIEIKARAKAFTNHPIQTYRFAIDEQGTVLVYDSVAGHYTVCHALSASAQRRIRKLAAETQR